MIDKNRPLYIFKYLLDNTDEEHPAIINDILAHLESKGIHATRKTVATDLAQLQDCGFDVVCNKSRQNKYFIGTRSLELAELKLIVDAVQAAKFISSSKSYALIEKLSALGSPFQADDLKRTLYVEGKPKTTNESVLYTVDILHHSIHHRKTVQFQYIEYTPRKEQALKHNGQVYKLSPYDLVWSNDRYYVFGWSDSHKKVVKFRVDRMVHVAESFIPFHEKPSDYSIEELSKQVFMMYEGSPQTIRLRCKNELMKTIIDKFGNDVVTEVLDDTCFQATVSVSVSPTFYSWIFTYGGNIEIVSPAPVAEEYAKRLETALNNMG